MRGARDILSKLGSIVEAKKLDVLLKKGHKFTALELEEVTLFVKRKIKLVNRKKA